MVSVWLPTQAASDCGWWPTGMRVIVRRERPHPGAQLSLFEETDGWRYQAFATNTSTGQLAFLEARHPMKDRGWLPTIFVAWRSSAGAAANVIGTACQQARDQRADPKAHELVYLNGIGRSLSRSRG